MARPYVVAGQKYRGCTRERSDWGGNCLDCVSAP